MISIIEELSFFFLYFLLSHINVNSHRWPKAAALVRTVLATSSQEIASPHPFSVARRSTVQKGLFAHQATTEGCLSPSSLLLLHSVLEQTANCTGLSYFSPVLSLINNLDIHSQDKKDCCVHSKTRICAYCFP